MTILVINAGSSSLKYQLFDTSKKAPIIKGLCERIGVGGSISHEVVGKDEYTDTPILNNHKDAIQLVLKLITDPELGGIKDINEIEAIGHRVVHGGEFFSESVIVDETVMAHLEECIPLAPLHNPHHIACIRACQEAMPTVPQVTAFDTAFHQTMPEKAFLYAIPYEYYEKHKIRRYGFHGISHKYVSQRAAEILGRPVEELKLVSCHLGNGSSVCAINGGKSVDTTMGFTPLVGLPMTTRTGDIDPTVVTYLMEREKLTAEGVLDIFNKKSGMYGICGVSADCLDIRLASDDGHHLAGVAIDMFNYNVRKTIGAYAAAMDGVDAVIMTAAIGQRDFYMRKPMLENLEYMGIKLDQNKNWGQKKEAIISTDDSPVKIIVIPTNEELMIAMDTEALISEYNKNK